MVRSRGENQAARSAGRRLRRDPGTAAPHEVDCIVVPNAGGAISAVLPTTSSSVASPAQDEPAVDIQLHVKNVPANCTLERLLQEFRPFGKIIEGENHTFIVTDRATRAPKGRAFVHFESLDCADAAISELHRMRCLDTHSCPLEVEYKRGETERLGLPNDAGSSDFENKLFVGNLPKEYDEAQVSQLFEPYGPLREVRVVRDRSQQANSKGAAFVKLLSKERALHAIYDFAARPRNLIKKRVEVRYADMRRHPKSGEVLGSYVEQTTVLASSGPVHWPTANNGGWTRVPTADGKEYYYNMISRQCQQFPPSELASGLAMSAVVAVSHLPPSWDERDLAQHFSQLGDVQESRVADDGRGYGLICFSNPVSASNAVVAMDGHIIGGRQLRVQQLTLATAEFAKATLCPAMDIGKAATVLGNGAWLPQALAANLPAPLGTGRVY